MVHQISKTLSIFHRYIFYYNQKLSTFILIITLFTYSHQNYVIHQIRI